MRLRSLTPWPDGTEAISALERAWSVTTLALALLLAVLVLAPMWDRAIFTRALCEALSRDAQLMQSLEAPPDSSAGPETNVRHIVSNSDNEGPR